MKLVFSLSLVIVASQAFANGVIVNCVTADGHTRKFSAKDVRVSLRSDLDGATVPYIETAQGQLILLDKLTGMDVGCTIEGDSK